ncbi:MAG: outer membrane lipoprotein-sorting protein [Pseudomonadota bacterium]
MMHKRALRATVLAASFAVAGPVAAASPEAEDLAKRIATREANEGRAGIMNFSMRNAKGRERRRSAVMLHSDRGTAIKIAIFFIEPAAIRDTAFLSHDYNDGPDQSWLFLPATDRVRRLPSSDQRDYFMGTDLTYGDVKNDFKFDLSDWTFDEVARSTVGEPSGLVLTGRAASPAAAKDMGYGAFRALVDPDTLFPVEIDYYDENGALLKEVRVLDQQRVGGAWTAMRFTAANVQTGHQTEVIFEDMRYAPELTDRALSPETLVDGPPRLD